MFDDFLHWTFDNPFKSVLIALAILLGIIYLAYQADKREMEEFMSECLQHRERYECVAMWRAGNSRASTYPIIVRTP